MPLRVPLLLLRGRTCTWTVARGCCWFLRLRLVRKAKRSHRLQASRNQSPSRNRKPTNRTNNKNGLLIQRPRRDSFLCGLFLDGRLRGSEKREHAPALHTGLCYTRPHVFRCEKTLPCRCDGACLPRVLCAHASAAHWSRRRPHKRPLSVRKYLATADQGLPAGLHRNCLWSSRSDFPRQTFRKIQS